MKEVEVRWGVVELECCCKTSAVLIGSLINGAIVRI